MSTSADIMAFPANLRSVGEMSSGPVDLLLLSMFFFCTDCLVSSTKGGAGIRLNVVLPSNGACCVGIGSELIKFSPIAGK